MTECSMCCHTWEAGLVVGGACVDEEGAGPFVDDVMVGGASEGL